MVELGAVHIHMVDPEAVHIHMVEPGAVTIHMVVRPGAIPIHMVIRPGAGSTFEQQLLAKAVLHRHIHEPNMCNSYAACDQYVCLSYSHPNFYDHNLPSQFDFSIVNNCLF